MYLECSAGVHVRLQGRTLFFDGDATCSVSNSMIRIHRPLLAIPVAHPSAPVNHLSGVSTNRAKPRPTIQKRSVAAPKPRERLPQKEHLLPADTQIDEIQCTEGARFTCEHCDALTRECLSLKANFSSQISIGYAAAIKLDGVVLGVSIDKVEVEADGASEVRLRVAARDITVSAKGASTVTEFHLSRSGAFGAEGRSIVEGLCTIAGCSVTGCATDGGVIVIEHPKSHEGHTPVLKIANREIAIFGASPLGEFEKIK